MRQFPLRRLHFAMCSTPEGIGAVTMDRHPVHYPGATYTCPIHGPEPGTAWHWFDCVRWYHNLRVPNGFVGFKQPHEIAILPSFSCVYS